MANSVVDYDAWKRGYMPPSEHVLIDELSYRGAKVVSSSNGSKGGWWLVVRGDVDRKTLVNVSKHLHMMIEWMDEEESPPLPLVPSAYGE